MYLDTIVEQIKSWIPEFTSYFSEEQTIVSIVVINGLCTVTTSGNHRLLTGDLIYIKNAIIPVKISSISKEAVDSEVATVTTDNYHDQTTGYTTISPITGVSDALYNGDKQFIDDIDGYNFTIVVDSATQQNPDVTNGYFLLNKKQLVNGWKTITKISATQFSYQEALTTLNATISNTGITLTKNQRVYACSDYLDAYDLYCNSFGKTNSQTNEIEDVIFKNDNQLTLYIALLPIVKNSAIEDTSSGEYRYTICLYIFAPIKNSRRYLARDKMSFLQSQVFNKILGNKTLQTDELYNVPETEEVKFVQSKMAAPRNRVIYPYEFVYEFRIRTWDDDYELPLDSTRLNKLDLRSSINNSNELLITNINY